jgi:hypothetical protein
MVVGNFAYVAAGSAGLQIVNISDPLAPSVSGSLNTAGEAWDVVVKGTQAYVANGANGLVIVDVSTPASPVRLGSLSLPGTSKGVDVDAVRQIATVALGTNGLAVVNVANPAAPALMGTLPGGDVRDLAISGNFVFLADFSRSFTSVDLSNPAAPVLRASTQLNLGGRLQDVVVNGSLAAGADVLFVNGVPMIDVSTPASPQPRIIIDFSAFRDDNGTGIAMDSNFVYLTASRGITENGVTETTRLYIGQYRNIQDNNGIPPTVQITSPASGTQVIQGSTLTVTATATDDVGVAAVNFFVNGQLAFTTSTAPYQYTFTAPSTGSTLTIGATAVDFGNNVGQASNVSVNMIPDPLTTAVGIIVDKSNNPVVGATVTCLGLTTQSGADGAFSIPSLPTVNGSIQCSASFKANNRTFHGTSPAFAPVPGGTTNVGTIIIREGNILLLADVNGPSTDALVNALTAAGNTVAVHAPEYTWDTTNPSLTNFNCVIHLDGATYATPLPAQSQAALESFVNNGGGFIGSQWDGFERARGIQTGMPNLVLQLWGFANGEQDCGPCSVTYNVVPGQENHPVLAGVPSSFTFSADGQSAGSAVQFATNPSTVLMRIPAGGPAVLVRSFGNGRVVNFSWAPNYLSTKTLLDPNVQKLYINAVNWVADR